MGIVHAATSLLSFLTLMSGIGIVIAAVVFIIALLTGKRKKLMKSALFQWIGKRGMLFSFIVAATATVGSLFFSEVAGYEPCKLCWYQRIMMYPLVLILGLALGTKQKIVTTYTFVFSAIGAFIASDHYYLQITQTHGLIPCSTIGQSVSCSDTFIKHFGYITIPMMALTAFVLIFIGMWMHRNYEHV